MNREIRFRVWDKQKKQYWYNKELQMFFDAWHKELLKYDEKLHDDNRFVWQQYTGLKDKNDKEIYAGDILCVQTEDNPEDLQWELASVEFKNGCFWINGVFEQPLYEIKVDENIDGKIVGNILENSELLE